MGATRGLPDNIPSLVRASATTATLAATSQGQATRITIGGQQYRLSSPLTLTITGTGAGGLDTGSFASTFTLYYVYAVVSSGVVSLVASTAAPSTGPSGFSSRYTLVGALYSSDTALTIGATVKIVGQAASEWMSFNPTGSFTGNTSYTGRWRRMGVNAEIHYRLAFTAAPTPSTNLTLDMPSGLTLSSSVLNQQVLGTFRGRDNGVNTYPGIASNNLSNNIAVAGTGGTAGTTGEVTPTVPFAFNTGDNLTVSVVIEMTGFSESLI